MELQQQQQQVQRHSHKRSSCALTNDEARVFDDDGLQDGPAKSQGGASFATHSAGARRERNGGAAWGGSSVGPAFQRACTARAKQMIP